MKGVQALQNEAISERSHNLARPLLDADYDRCHQREENGPKQREWDNDAFAPVHGERRWSTPGPKQCSEETGHDKECRHPEGVNDPEGKIQGVGRVAVDVGPVTVARISYDDVQIDAE
jgi:hypothetical protein